MTAYQLPFVGLLIGAAGGGLVVVVVVTAVVICLCRHARAKRRHNGVSGTSSRSGASGGRKAFSNVETAPVANNYAKSVRVDNRVYDDIVEPTVSGNFFPCASNKGSFPLQKSTKKV